MSGGSRSFADSAPWPHIASLPSQLAPAETRAPGGTPPAATASGPYARHPLVPVDLAAGCLILS